MIELVLAQIQDLMRLAREAYGVDPVVFLVIYLVSVPIFYYSLFRMIRALALKNSKETMLWSTIFLCTIVAPFLYVLFFGRNLPWWVYGVIVILIGQGVLSVRNKLRGKATDGDNKVASSPEKPTWER